jgi:hypothetical protein
VSAARLVGISHVAPEVGVRETGVAGGELGLARLPRPLRRQRPGVDYREIQLMKAAAVLRGMGLEALGKDESARRELREKGLAD